MGPTWFVAFLVMLKEAWSARRDAHIRFLKLQLEMVKSRLPGNLVILDPVERRRLMKVGAELGHAVEHTPGIVRFKTYRRWLREEQGGRQPGKVGRPRLTKSLRELIVRLARENVGWGARRILGEFKKLAVKASRSSVRRVLVDEKIPPDPERHAPKGVQTTWRKFIAIHMNVMVACDFFCKTVWTPLGKQVALVRRSDCKPADPGCVPDDGSRPACRNHNYCEHKMLRILSYFCPARLPEAGGALGRCGCRLRDLLAACNVPGISTAEPIEGQLGGRPYPQARTLDTNTATRSAVWLGPKVKKSADCTVADLA